MTVTTMTFKKKHVLLVPYPAFGHVTPLLELGKKLVESHHVTFLVSDCKIASIRRKEIMLHQDDSDSSVKLLGLMDGLTDEDDKNLTPARFMSNLKRAGTVMRQIYRTMPVGSKDNQKCDYQSQLFTGTMEWPVDTVISDLVMGAYAVACFDRGVPFHIFNPSPGIILLKLLESVLINSVTEFEPNTTKTIEKHPFVLGKPVRFVAPLFPEADTGKNAKQPLSNKVTLSQIRQWLNNRTDNTVTYVSFGSMAIPSQDQIREIAKALMTLQRPFIWSLKTAEQEYLPEELLANMENQFECDLKYIIVPWVPQKMVLKHPATRLFISHCGWNSTMEAIVGGVPVVAWPLFGDQHWDAELLVKEGMALKIPDTDLFFTRLVTAEEIVQVILKVGGATGRAMMIEPFRRNAKMARKMTEIAVRKGGSSYVALQELIVDIGTYHIDSQPSK
ncbi:uncharacterized protein LOC129602044 [Paramacrobiotus metropolitanus]|uniref:uncharacterized protein LOC129602044 n=1 Tax=Paramacrobiotus metropolitanus TaxID=2943436 RepID=UPI002445A2E1|nr:uncharacterized protein LOC129602044 [Paramacrobiotus metropolitanus]